MYQKKNNEVSLLKLKSNWNRMILYDGIPSEYTRLACSSFFCIIFKKQLKKTFLKGGKSKQSIEYKKNDKNFKI